MKKTNTESKIVYNQNKRFWDIPGVLYRGERGIYRLFKRMTPSINQDKLAEVYEIEKRKGNPYPTDMPLIWTIITRAYELRDEKQEKFGQSLYELRNFFRLSFRESPGTLTRIYYEPSNSYYPLRNDLIVHNYNTLDGYLIDAEVVGSTGWINEISDKDILEKILGTSNIQRINGVSQYINGTDSYFDRLDFKPIQKEVIVARFGATDVRFSLDCRWGCFESPSFMVLRLD